MKKVISLILVFVIFMVLMVGCGEVQEVPQVPASALPSKAAAQVRGRPVTISVMHYLVEKPKIQALQNLADGFYAKNPNIKVDIQSMSLDQYANVLKMKLASGDSPNVIFGNPKSYREVVDSGNILDITNQDFVKRVDPKFIANVTIDGKVFGIPLDLMPSGVFYNKDIFRSTGVEVPKTWPAFIKVCEILKAKGITPIAAGYKDQASIGGGCYTEVYGTPLSKMPDFRSQVMSGEKKLADFPEFKAFLQRFDTRNKYVNSDSLQIGIDRAEQMFASGKTAMIVLGSWGIGAVRSYGPNGNFGIFMFPATNDGNELMATGTDDTWMLATHANNQAEGLKFFDYMTTQEAASKWADDVQAISAIAGAKASKLDPMAQDLQTIFDTGKVENWLAVQDFYGQYLDIWMRKLQELAYNQGTDIDKFIADWDAEIAKARTTAK